MSLGIYKQGQGYWVRVLTACFCGALVLASAAWLAQQMGALTLPTPNWDFTARTTSGVISAGQSVDLLDDRQGQAGQEFVSIGTAQVQQVIGTGSFRLGSFNFTDGASAPGTVDRIRIGSADAPTFSADIATRRGVPVIEPLVLQSIVGAAVLLVGALLIYYFVGVKKSSSEFLIATDGEMKKVNWSTRKEIIGSTWVVVAATFLIAAFLFSVDQGFSLFFKLIGVLDS